MNNITKKKIAEKLANLDERKGCGSDNIPGIFIQNCRDQLIEPLYIIYNKSLHSGIFPSVWKQAKVIPIYKNGAKHFISSYRAVSLLCIFSKIFEACICDELFFKLKAIVCDKQHGFYKERSVVTNLIEFTQHLSNLWIEEYKWMPCIPIS